MHETNSSFLWNYQFPYLAVKLQHNFECMVVHKSWQMGVFWATIDEQANDLRSLFVPGNISGTDQRGKYSGMIEFWLIFSCFVPSLRNNRSSLQNPVNKSTTCTHCSWVSPPAESSIKSCFQFCWSCFLSPYVKTPLCLVKLHISLVASNISQSLTSFPGTASLQLQQGVKFGKISMKEKSKSIWPASLLI